MEPNTHKIIQDKILEAEQIHTEWNRDKVLAGLNFAPKAKKKKVGYYYAVAASLLFIFLLQYNWFSNTTPNYQARLKKVGTPTPTLDTNAIKAIKPVPAQKPANNVQSKKARQKNTVTTKTAIEIKTTNQIARNNKEQASTPLSSENTIKTIPKAKVAARKKIEPIIGIAYKEEIKVKIQKSIPIQFEFGKQQNNNSTVDNTTFSVLKTTLN